jgi:GTP-binding protein
VERSRILLHLVDVSETAEGDPVENMVSLNLELRLYSAELAEKPMAVAGTKTDIRGDGRRLDRLAEYCETKGADFFPLCAPTHEGVPVLLEYLSGKLRELWDEDRHQDRQ